MITQQEDRFFHYIYFIALNQQSGVKRQYLAIEISLYVYTYIEVAFPKSGGLPIWELPILTELRKIGIDSKFILPMIDSRIDHEFYDVAKTIRGIPPINRMINNLSFSEIMNGIFNVRTVDLTSSFAISRISRKTTMSYTLSMK